jgi:hypothetical protein
MKVKLHIVFFVTKRRWDLSFTYPRVFIHSGKEPDQYRWFAFGAGEYLQLCTWNNFDRPFLSSRFADWVIADSLPQLKTDHNHYMSFSLTPYSDRPN